MHPEMVGFIQGEMQWRVQDGFSILLPAEDVLRVFVEKIKLSSIAAVPQAHRRPRLILDLSAQPDKVTPSVNGTIDREGDRPGVNAVWVSIPMHPPGDLGGRSGRGSGPGFAT